ncbi:MAG: molybdenum ABC transporter ATP-binding protein, partial [Mesorhizobium sp.]
VRIRIRARDVMIATGQPTGLSALNILPGTIVAIEPGEGPTVEIGIDCNGATVIARITEQSRQTLKLQLGRKVYAVVKTVSFDRANTGAGLPVEADG